MKFEAGFSKGLALEGGAKANDFDTLEEAIAKAKQFPDRVKCITKEYLRGKLVYSVRKGSQIIKWKDAVADKRKPYSILI